MVRVDPNWPSIPWFASHSDTSHLLVPNSHVRIPLVKIRRYTISLWGTTIYWHPYLWAHLGRISSFRPHTNPRQVMRMEITYFLQVMTEEILEVNPKFPLDRVANLWGFFEFEFNHVQISECGRFPLGGGDAPEERIEKATYKNEVSPPKH